MSPKKIGRVTALVGAQYGSEGKGIVVHHIANEYSVHIRTGAPNAGHTFYHEGQKWVMQTVPCGWTNPNATLIIGRGALIDMDILVKEVSAINAVDPSIHDRLIIDAKAGIISKWHSDEEGGVHGEMHQRIGSTGKGCGAARRDRLMRDPDKFRFFESQASQYSVIDVSTGEELWSLADLMAENTPSIIESHYINDANILLEGAQGSGLSLIHGPWPYATSTDTNAAQMCADCGLPPQYLTDVLLVARTFPIRVAGNSGPLKNERDWEYISERMGRPVREMTTVTHKVRRIGDWDEDLIVDAITLNGAREIVITFMDYLCPEDEGVEDYRKLSITARTFIEYVEVMFNVKVPFVVTGGQDFPHVCSLSYAYGQHNPALQESK